MRVISILAVLVACDREPGRPVVPRECGPGFADECVTERDCLDPASWQCLEGHCYQTCDIFETNCDRLFGACPSIPGGWNVGCFGIDGPRDYLHSGQEPACVPIFYDMASGPD